MKMIILNKRQSLVMPVSILLYSEIDMMIEFELALDKHNRIGYIKYGSDKKARSVPWIHLPKCLPQYWEGVCYLQLQQLHPFNCQDLVR